MEQGATWSRRASLPSFSVVVRCEGVKPDRFVADVALNGTVVAHTTEHASLEAAEGAANTLIAEAFARLFG